MKRHACLFALRPRAAFGPRSLRPARAQQGLTLVELMVAMVLGLFIVLALSAVYLNMSRSTSEMAKSSMQIENGRYALQSLETDLLHVGYWGSYVPSWDSLAYRFVPKDVPTAVPNPCLAEADWGDSTKTLMPNHSDYPLGTEAARRYKDALIGVGIQTYEVNGAGVHGAPVSCNSYLVSPQPNTDILVVRYAEPCVPGAAANPNCEADVAGRVYFQASHCRDDDVRYTGSTADRYQNYVLAPNGFTLQNGACAGVAEVKRRYIANLYYVRTYAVNPGDGIPTLMRAGFTLRADGPRRFEDPTPWVEGIEHFRVELGIDSLAFGGGAVDPTAAIAWDTGTPARTTNRGDGEADGAYVHCTTATPCTAAQLLQAVAARVHLVARARTASTGYTDTKTYNLGVETVGPKNDAFKRHLFTTTVRFMNPSGRRETPN